MRNSDMSYTSASDKHSHRLTVHTWHLGSGRGGIGRLGVSLVLLRRNRTRSYREPVLQSSDISRYNGS